MVYADSQWREGFDGMAASTGTKELQSEFLNHTMSNWLVVWNIFYFPYFGNNDPNWQISFRGDETTNKVMSVWQSTTFYRREWDRMESFAINVWNYELRCVKWDTQDVFIVFYDFLIICIMQLFIHRGVSESCVYPQTLPYEWVKW